MIHLQSNQRLYISEDLHGYVKKLKEEGTVVNAADFLQLGFAYAVDQKLDPAEDLERHELTDIYTLGDAQIVLEAITQWYARRLSLPQPKSSKELLNLMCQVGVSGGRVLRDKWRKKTKSQVQSHIIRLAK